MPELDTEPMRSLVYSPDGCVIITGAGATLRSWCPWTGKPIASVPNVGDAIRSLAISADGRALVAVLRAGTVVVWDLARIAATASVAKVNKERLTTAWADLGSRDATVAYRTSWSLVAQPAATTAFLASRLKTVPLVTPAATPARLRQLIADLDHDDFERREAASQALGKQGVLAKAALHQALAETTSLEVRRRLLPLIEALPPWVVTSPEELRALRAIAVLHRIGTPEARAILTKLAKGAPQARQTRAAQASLDALNRMMRP
jgi:hypothetical protein